VFATPATLEMKDVFATPATLEMKDVFATPATLEMKDVFATPAAHLSTLHAPRSPLATAEMVHNPLCPYYARRLPPRERV
jgi:hypothetical protein